MEKGEKKVVIRAVSLPAEIDRILETARKKLKLGRSKFYLIAIMNYLKQISILSSAVRESL